MTDEFLEVATKEIKEELCELETLLTRCKNDHDVTMITSEFQKHTHKIKGLAPMMGQDSLGDVAKSLDSLLKKFMDGGDVVGILVLLSEIFPFMRSLMTESKIDSVKVQQKISKIENLLN